MPVAASCPAEAELGELADGVREQVDADPEGAQLAGRVQDERLESGGVQAERGGQPRDAGPGDDHAHETRHQPHPEHSPHPGQLAGCGCNRRQHGYRT